MTSKNLSNRDHLSPSAIAQFYKLQQCPMYLYHRYVNEDFAGISDISLSPLLAATGEKFEESQVKKLLESDVYSIGQTNSSLSFNETWSGDTKTDLARIRGLVDEIKTGELERPIVLYQPPVEGTIGAWPVHGDADIVIITSDASRPGKVVEVRVIEVKSSSSVKTHHQIQAAIYSLLFESLLDNAQAEVTASVVSQDPEYTDLGSIVTRTSGIDLRRLSTFDLSTRQNDVQLLFEENGTLDDILLEGEEMRTEGTPPQYRIDARCDGCSKQTKCLAHSVTNKRLSLLGLTEGVQQSLQDLGVSNLHEFATLYDWPTDSNERTPTSYIDPSPTDPALVNEILRETEISNLTDLTQIAHRFLREIDPTYADEWSNKAEDGPWGDYLIGSGRNLPDDDPHPAFELDYPRRSLVRVYPYVQHDTVRNRVVMLAAKVTSTRYEQENEDDIFVVAKPKCLPNTDVKDKDEEERRLIDQFFERLSEAIDRVRPSLSGEGYSDEDGFLHFYPYGESQRGALIEAVKRHPDSDAAQALRTLFGYREDIDQEVVSVLRNEFRERHAFRYPGLGVVQTAAQFYGADLELDWEAPRDSDKTPLKETFAADLFEISVPYEEIYDRIQLSFDKGLQIADDHMQASYPVVSRHRDDVPLEYIYAAEEFDLLRPELANDDATRQRIIRYRRHLDEDSPRITLDDIEDAVHAICNAYEHIERCIRHKDATISKAALNLSDLRQNSLGVSELQSTCLEYQNLEFGAKRRELEAQYRTPLRERVASGKALPIEVITPPVESDKEDEERTWVEGSVLRSLGNGSPDGVRPNAQLHLESGNYVVLTQLTEGPDGGLTEDIGDPHQIQHQVLGKLTQVNSNTGNIRVSLNWQRNQSRQKFKPNHVGWTSNPDDPYSRRFIEEGMSFVLDPAVDGFVAHRAYQSLQHADKNDVHNRLINLYEDGIPDALQTDTPLFDPDALDRFIETFDNVMPESTNYHQRTFISRANHTVGALQGPPGTGKTRYSSAPALLARAYSVAPHTFSAIASAHSNTAVDEIAEAVGEAQKALKEAGVEMEIKLIRVRSGMPTGELPSNIAEYNYYDDRKELNSILQNHLLEDASEGPIIVFTTPVTLRNLIHGASSIVADDANSAEDLMREGQARLFDFALVDEASMMDLPLLFLIGSFLGKDKQLLLIGDHRQMQPIQKHDWENEDRQTIEENTPFVSALDFIRFLRGDEDSTFERLDRESPTWQNNQSVLPMDRLRKTYRLPPAMAEFETDLFYHLDDIKLESSGASKTMPDVRNNTLPEWLNAALDPQPRVTLLLHNDNIFTKENALEIHLAQQLLSRLPVVPDNPNGDEVTGGIVVPFRLMRRKLRQQFDLTVDTVERFQGGERDIMVLSMTASNQGYVNQISEFLLDANRFNVGASRMRQKLYIFASKSLFRAINSDPQKYEQQKAWKHLYQSLVAGKAPREATTIGPADVDALNHEVNVQVYTGYHD